MSKTHRYIGKAKNTIDRLKLKGENFQVVTTSKTENVRTKNINYLFSEKHYYGKIFGLLSQLKKMLNDNYQHIHDSPYAGNSKNVEYYNFNSKKNFNIDVGTIYDIPNVIEADISSAYYRTAFNLGFITEEFYLRCKSLDKTDRLVLIGSIATIKTIDYYEKGKRVKSEIVKNDLYRMAWFKICSYVDSALITLMERFNRLSPDIFLFYWVDGIYFRNFQVTKHYNWQTIFKEVTELFPFDWKYQRIKQLRVINEGEKGLKIEIKKQDGTKKTFFPPKRNVKLYYLDKDGKPVNIDSNNIPEMNRVKF